MKSLVYFGPQEIGIENRPRPKLQWPSDAIVKIHHTTICGTDLQVIRGSVPTVGRGRVLGHEGVGVVEEIGASVTNFKVGDRVVIACNTSCGKCANCKRGLLGQCHDGGWVLGNISDGCQAEYVRIPHADHSLHALPDALDPQSAVMLSDVLPSGFELGVRAAKLEPGQSLAIVGAGPVGMAALITAHFYSPSRIIMVDVDEHRLSTSLSLGATDAVNNKDNTAAEQILALTKGRGVDVAIESIGLPVGWEVCEAIVCSGGHIAMLGVHGKSVTLHLEEMWKKNFTLTAGLVHTTTIPMLMEAALSRRIKPEPLISHRFNLSEIMQAYETFGAAAKHNALKVIVTNDC